jgi:Toprim domain
MTTNPARVPLDAIVAGLSGRIVDLCGLLLPAGINDGAEYAVGSLAGEPGQSCKIHIRQDGRAGVWKDFSTGETGDALDLVKAVLFHADRDKIQAIKWAKSFLGYDGSAEALNIQRRAAVQAKKNREEAERQALRRRKAATKMYLDAFELKGTPAEEYLRGRSIDFAKIGHWPGCLRFAPNCEAWERKKGEPKPVLAGKFPALLASICSPAGETVAVHRTYLARRPDGTMGKAPLRDAKKTFGTYAGGCIRLFKPILPNGKRAPGLKDAPAGSAVAISEGIEDGLSFAMLDRTRYVLVAVSLSNMGALWLPEAIDDVLIVGQNDEKPEARAALDAAVERFALQGRTVRVSRPPPEFKDINDVLRGVTKSPPGGGDKPEPAFDPRPGSDCLPVELAPSAGAPAGGDL